MLSGLFGGGALDNFGPDQRGRPSPVIDHDLLAHLLAQLLRSEPPDKIGAPAGPGQSS